MLTKTKAIVLHSFRYGERKLIVDLLTYACGRVSCIVKTASSPKGKLRKQCFQPLTLLELIIDQRPQRSLQTISEAHVSVPYTTLPFNPYKLSISLFVAEFLRAVTRREPADEALYAYVENSLRWLDECQEGFANFHLVFLMRLTRFLGFYPNAEDYADGSWFDLRTSTFSPSAPLHNDALPPAEAKKIGLLLRMNFATMHLYKMSRADRNRMVDVILSYYRLHQPDMTELKSLDVLRELFAE